VCFFNINFIVTKNIKNPYFRHIMETVVSGIRSTGKLHLGNYYGAIQNFVKMQHEYNCYFFIADLHSLTTHPTPDDLHGNVKQVLVEYLAAGIDPEKATIYIQSDVPEIAELYLYMNMNAYMGELERSTSFKDKVRANPDNVNAGLLTYPVLMAADILIHKAPKYPWVKTRSNTWKWPAPLATALTVYTITSIFPSLMPLASAKAW
jgi:tryptophanyl-tRNA synthetase